MKHVLASISVWAMIEAICVQSGVCEWLDNILDSILYLHLCHQKIGSGGLIMLVSMQFVAALYNTHNRGKKRESQSPHKLYSVALIFHSELR